MQFYDTHPLEKLEMTRESKREGDQGMTAVMDEKE
jgi:hypothetical protein